MPQNLADSTAFLNGVGEREIQRTTKRVREKRLQQRYSHGLLWLPYRKLKSHTHALFHESSSYRMEERQDMLGILGVQILPLSKGGLSHRYCSSGKKIKQSKKKGGRYEYEAAMLLLEEAMVQMVRHSCSSRLLCVQDEDHVPDHIFMERLEKILRKTSFPAWRLDFSFPHSVFCKGAEHYWFNLASLRDGGARIFMRDFLAAPSNMVLLEEAYKASILDGVQCRMGYFLSQNDKDNIWEEKEAIFRQHILKAVRSLGLIIQINDVSLEQEDEIIHVFNAINHVEDHETSLIEDSEKNTHCEIIAPFSEALASLDDETHKAALRSRHAYMGFIKGELA